MNPLDLLSKPLNISLPKVEGTSPFVTNSKAPALISTGSSPISFLDKPLNIPKTESPQTKIVPDSFQPVSVPKSPLDFLGSPLNLKSSTDPFANIPGGFPFTERAKEIIKQTPISYGRILPAGVGGATGSTIELPRKGEGSVKSTIVLTPDEPPLTKNYEIFHALFDKTNINPQAFNQAWEMAKKNNPDMQRIDNEFNAPGNEAAYQGQGPSGEDVSKDPLALAHERFASLGSTTGRQGHSAIPIELQPFYKDFLNEKRTTAISPFEPLPAGRTVRNQDWKDAVNALPQAAFMLAEPAISAALSLGEAAVGKQAPKIQIPLLKGQKLTAESAQQEYFDNIKRQQEAGGPVSEEKAFWDTAIKTIGDMSVLVPLARDIGKAALLKITPERLINPEIIKTSRQEIFDYLSGRTPAEQSPLPPELKQAISETLRTGTREEKLALFRGVDMTQAKPSLLGKMVGITQGEADQILSDLYGKGTRAVPVGELPGYRMTGQEGGINARGEPVGFERNYLTPEEKTLHTKVANGLVDSSISNEDAITLLEKKYPIGNDVIKSIVNEASNIAEGGNKQEVSDFLNKQFVKPTETKPLPSPTPPSFKGFKDITTNVLDKLQGRGVVSKQFISDLTNSPDLKQPERDLIRNVLEKDYKNNEHVPVKEFADKVHSELLPLETGKSGMERNAYENIVLPDELRGPVADYRENIYSSPIKTSAGSVHFGGEPHYFAHTRVEDLPAPKTEKYLGDIAAGKKNLVRGKLGDENKGTTRRVIELQSDLFQRGRLEDEMPSRKVPLSPAEQTRYDEATKQLVSPEFKSLSREEKGKIQQTIYDLGVGRAEEKIPNARREKQLAQLEPYRNTWQERIIREEIKRAAEDGKAKLQFPTGETAMKIEGLGDNTQWHYVGGQLGNRGRAVLGMIQPNELEVGREIMQTTGVNLHTTEPTWIITDVLGDGKFKAVPKSSVDTAFEMMKRTGEKPTLEKALVRGTIRENAMETFDISGKVDTENPIYKFYEKEVGRYLKNKYDAKIITDPQGVKWFEVDIKPEMANKPVTAFQKGEGFTPNISKEQAVKIINSIFKPGEINLVFDKNLLERHGAIGLFKSSGTSPIGSYTKAMIRLLEDKGMVHDKTVYHEAFHAYFNRYLTNAERATAIGRVKDSILTSAYKLYPKENYPTAEARAEEWLADDFAEYVSNEKEYKGFFARLWENLLNKIRNLIRRTNKFDELYQRILKGEKIKGQEIKAFRAQMAEPNPEIQKYEPTTPEAYLSPKAEELRFLREQRSELLSVLADSPARQLIHFVSPATGDLPELGVEGRFGKSGDQIMQELGFDDIEDANKAIRSYRKSLAELRQTNEKIADLRKEVISEMALRKEQNLSIKNISRRLQKKAIDRQEYINERKGLDETILDHNGNVPPPIARGGIRPPEVDFSKWKDIATARLARDTMERNLEKVAPKEDAKKINEFLVQHIRDNETRRVKYVSDIRKEIRKTFKELGLSRRDDRWVQIWGEKMMSLDQLRSVTKNWGNVIKAVERFRGVYDKLLTDVNNSRELFGYKPIPRRSDYFRHFAELNWFTQEFGLLFSPHELPTEIAGITDIFKPGKPFTTAELRRIGHQTKYAATRGLDNYLNSVTRQMFHIDSVQRGRALEKYIREASGAVARESIDPISGFRREPIILPNFVANLQEYTNLISGKASVLDRSIERYAGRNVMRFLNALRHRFGANVIAGNISASITHAIPTSFNLATVNKWGAVRGLLHTLVSPFVKNFNSVDGMESSFLARRFHTEKIMPSVPEVVSHALAFPFKIVDQFISKLAVSSKYFEAISKGFSKEEAIKIADNYAQRVIGDRSIGNLPNVMNSRSLGFLTQFQIEVNDNLQVLLHDIPKGKLGQDNPAKAVFAILQFMIFSHLFNIYLQKLKGSGKGLDPIDLGQTLLGWTEDSKGKSLWERTKLFTGDLVKELPFSSIVTGQYPVAQGLPFTDIQNGDMKSALTSTAAGFLSPIGGGTQVKKMIQGLQTWLAGYTSNAKGTAQYPIDKNVSTFLKLFLFGKSSISNNAADQMLEIYNHLQDLKADGKKTEANKIYNALSPLEKDTYKKLKTKLKRQETIAKTPGIKAIYENNQKLKAQGKIDEANKIYRELSAGDKRIYQNLKKDANKQGRVVSAELKYQNKAPYSVGQKATDSNVVDTILTYAKAVGTDPLTAFSRIFTGQKIRRIDNGTIIVERMSKDESQAVKTQEGGNNPTMKLDHTIPLELGGSNSRDNLRLVSTEEWNSYTPIENFLGKKLRAGTITKAKAQELIKMFKTKQISAQEVYNYKQ